MKGFFAFSIVCFSLQTAFAQLPLTPAESESRDSFIRSVSIPAGEQAWAILEDTATWKDWEVVENYSFGKNRGSIPMIADLESLHPYFRDRVLELIRVCAEKGINLAVVETYRTHAKQNEYRSMGRNYTRSGAGHSKHQYGLAVDVVAMNDTIPQWNNYALWRKIGMAGEKLGLRWGGRWRHPYDPGHFEWTGGLGTRQLAQGIFPALPRQAVYPCLEEDLGDLRRHWKSWETEQAALARTMKPTRITQKQHRPKSIPGGAE